MGCGRVGASLAEQLEDSGHSVAVVDQNPDAFRRLPADFGGRRVTALGFDRDALTQAGIEEAHAFAAVSNGDNSNIIAARVAREVFGVGNVVARIYDPRRAEVYSRLGIPTVATVRWTADQVLRRMMPMGAFSEYQDPSSAVSLVRCDVNPGWVGEEIERIESAARARVAYLTRHGKGRVPERRAVVQENDTVHLMVPTDRIGAVQRILERAPGPEAEED
ncbi:potassium channel family protein [Georgenia deserti]|uniref:Potassium channel family protein n=1 Tax=Georgenia deserti TaxID=2093781 RepID=A0ABW4L8C5_9MICO